MGIFPQGSSKNLLSLSKTICLAQLTQDLFKFCQTHQTKRPQAKILHSKFQPTQTSSASLWTPGSTGLQRTLCVQRRTSKRFWSSVVKWTWAVSPLSPDLLLWLYTAYSVFYVTTSLRGTSGSSGCKVPHETGTQPRLETALILLITITSLKA